MDEPTRNAEAREPQQVGRGVPHRDLDMDAADLSRMHRPPDIHLAVTAEMNAQQSGSGLPDVIRRSTRETHQPCTVARSIRHAGPGRCQE